MDQLNESEREPVSGQQFAQHTAADKATSGDDLVLEIHQPGRQRSYYQRVSRFPFKVGRAYDNDLILPDDTVSAHHLVINKEEDGYQLDNLSTENGTQAGKVTLPVGNSRIQPPTTLLTGRTHIKVVRASEAVAPAKPLAKLSAITEWCSQLKVALLFLGVYLLVNVYDALAVQTIWINDSEVIVGQLFELLTPLVVATVTGFISRLLLHRWRFPFHLSLASITFLATNLLDKLFNFFDYYFTDTNIADAIQTALLVVVLVLLLAWLLRSLSHLSFKSSSLIGAGIVVPIFFVMFLQGAVSEDDFIRQPQMHNALRVMDFRLQEDIDSVSELTQTIATELNAAIAEEMANEPEEFAL